MPRIAAADAININVHVEGTTIPIILIAEEQYTSTTWGALCKIFVAKSLTTADAKLFLQILSKISPKKRFTHYFFRFGDGNASIIRVDWSPAGVPGFLRSPLEPGYVEVNMILKPVERGALKNLAQPHLPVRPVGVQLPSSIDVNLCISVVSLYPSDEFVYPTTQQPLPSDIARTSVVYLTEHQSLPGCVDSFRIVPADGVNNILPGNARMPEAPSAPAAIVTTTAETTGETGKKRKEPSKDGTSPTKAKGSTKKDTSKRDDDAKKPAAKDGKGGAAAKLKTPPKKSGADMIRLYEEAATVAAAVVSEEASAKKRKALSHTTETAPTQDKSKGSNKKKENTSKSDNDDGAMKPTAKGKGGDAEAAKKKSPPEESAAKLKSPPKKSGADMIRLYEEAKAKESSEKSSAAKSPNMPSIPQVISSKKTTKTLAKKGIGTSNAGDSAKKTPAAVAEEKSGDDKGPSADVGNQMIRLYEESKAKANAAEKKKTPSKKSEDSTNSSTSKEAKGSAKKDKVKSNEGESAKTPPAAEEGKSAKKKSSKGTDADGAKASKKKRKAPTDGESSDAPKSPSKKKAKTSKADESTPSKSNGEKSVAAKDGESEKKRGPKPKDYADIPSGPVKDLPAGWTLKIIPRSVGDKYDQKWYSPGGIAFRSKKGAASFIEILDRVHDEAAAYAVYQKEEKEAKELKKAEREAKKKKEAESIVV